MHQPDYRDPATGEPTMPWTRLHATRGYLDVPTAILSTGAIATVNLVPSLLAQLDHYAAGGTDPLLDLCRDRAEELEPARVAALLESAFGGSPHAFTWFPAWGRLRGLRDVGARFRPGQLRDVQVWSNLAWFGFASRALHPAIDELRAKGAEFSESDLATVLAIQRDCILRLRSLYAKLPEVSASPLAHPILPLLVDTRHARRALPAARDPGFRAPEDATRQLMEGKRAVEVWIGHAVEGLWPPEGAVSPEVVDLAANTGFRWFATDQHVLERSDRDPGDHRRAWRVGRMTGLFRDHALSDAVGFAFASRAGDEAAAELIHAVGDGACLLALDGENPWEHYRDAGEGFLLRFLAGAQLRRCGDWTPEGEVHRLHTGSWIDGTFDVWIGHEEDVMAWTLLRETRDAWVAAGRPESGWPSLAAAEGSDWCWWYGPQFSTPFALAFDTLFRGHLRAVWRAIDRPWPAALDQPLKAGHLPVVPPTGPVRGADWASWRSAGRWPLPQGSMARAGRPRELRFGWDGERLVLLLLGAEGWCVRVGRRTTPFQRGVATLEGDRVTLLGPDGERIPAVGAFHLPSPSPPSHPVP
jgi:alpha-amylase/alpha-mannosidase (GH57 family)